MTSLPGASRAAESAWFRLGEDSTSRRHVSLVAPFYQIFRRPPDCARGTRAQSAAAEYRLQGIRCTARSTRLDKLPSTNSITPPFLHGKRWIDLLQRYGKGRYQQLVSF
jgi:hypothetical protein